MFRLTGAPPSKPDPKHPKGQSGPMWFTDGEKQTALAMAQEFHDRGFRVRLINYAPGDFRCLFDSKQRARRKVKLAA